MRRRDFLRDSLLASAAWLPAGRAALPARRPHILLRPGTAQAGNIGDVAHTPGALRLFQRHFPAAAFSVWPVALSAAAREGLRDQFPGVRIVEGELDAQGRPNTPELSAAWAEADLLLHGSAPGFKGNPYLPAWRAASRRPYGIFGITDDPVSGIGARPEGGTLAELRAAIAALPPGHLRPATRALLDGAAFIFCRETLTAEHFRRQGVASPLIAFGPDATFALQAGDDPRAAAYLRAHDLVPGRFVCVVPRLRYTPYYRLQGRSPSAGDLAKEAVNARTRSRDHAKLRELIIRMVRNGGLRVLACPEMSYQVELARAELVEPLPADVRRGVVWRDTDWQPAEAGAIYRAALAIVSFECHSPILALARGTPALYIRQPTDTIKGQMYHDLGAGLWTREIEETSGEEIWGRVARIQADPLAARDRVRALLAKVDGLQQRMVEAAEAALT